MPLGSAPDSHLSSVMMASDTPSWHRDTSCASASKGDCTNMTREDGEGG